MFLWELFERYVDGRRKRISLRFFVVLSTDLGRLLGVVKELVKDDKERGGKVGLTMVLNGNKKESRSPKEADIKRTKLQK